MLKFKTDQLIQEFFTSDMESILQNRFSNNVLIIKSGTRGSCKMESQKVNFIALSL